jgi:hypothetical protein
VYGWHSFNPGSGWRCWFCRVHACAIRPDRIVVTRLKSCHRQSLKERVSCGKNCRRRREYLGIVSSNEDLRSVISTRLPLGRFSEVHKVGDAHDLIGSRAGARADPAPRENVFARFRRRLRAYDTIIWMSFAQSLRSGGSASLSCAWSSLGC